MFPESYDPQSWFAKAIHYYTAPTHNDEHEFIDVGGEFFGKIAIRKEMPR